MRHHVGAYNFVFLSMLSAVAARKARLQQNAPPPEPAQDRAQSPESPSEEEGGQERVKPPSKRKSSAPAPKPSRKKRKVNKPQDKKQGRYFEEKDGFKEQDDVIVVADEGEESNSSDESSDTPLPPPKAIRKPQRRAWSPSAPFQDSSDDEEGDATLEDAVLTPPVALRPAEEPPQVLSTYRPILGQNFFDITQEELKTIGISLTSPGKLLVLRSSDRLALLGTYSLTVLLGAVRLNGVLLTPSLHAHSVFAPRSSPLPVVEKISWVQGDKSAIPLPTRFSGSIVPGDTVILLQELRTGVEGLGRVCRTFEDVFTPTRWQRNQSTVDLGLQGVHYVSVPYAHSRDPIITRLLRLLSNLLTPSLSCFHDHGNALWMPRLLRTTTS